MTNQDRAEEIILGRLAADAAQELHEAGLLMPDLPKPDLKGGWKTEVIGGGKGFFAVRTPGVVEFVSSAGVYSNTSDMIRREALRMLAAANLAEKSTNG